MKYREFYGYKIYEDGTVENKHGRKMSVRNIENTYRRLSLKLSIKGKRKEFSLGRLVYCVFNDIEYAKLSQNKWVTYKNGNKLDCSLDNLKLVDKKDLIQGEKHIVSKLTDKETEQIRKLYDKTKNIKVKNQYDKNYELKNSYSKLAKQFGVTKENIAMIVSKNSRYDEDYKLK